jgi:hypothetical protein
MSQYDVAAMGFSILGGLLKGMSDTQAGAYNADVANRNAGIASMAAGDALARGQFAAGAALLRGSALAGAQKVAYANSNVSVNSGSALNVMGDTKMMSALDAAIIGSNAARSAWGYRNQSLDFQQQARLDQTAASNREGEDILGGIQGAALYGSKMMSLSSSRDTSPSPDFVPNGTHSGTDQMGP